MNPTDEKNLRALSTIAVMLGVPEKIWITYCINGKRETITDAGLAAYLALRLEPYRDRVTAPPEMIPIYDQGWEDEFIG